jgi:hypothetical protein
MEAQARLVLQELLVLMEPQEAQGLLALLDHKVPQGLQD